MATIGGYVNLLSTIPQLPELIDQYVAEFLYDLDDEERAEQLGKLLTEAVLLVVPRPNIPNLSGITKKLGKAGAREVKGRIKAFKNAKKDARIEIGQQPYKVEKVKMTDRNGKAILDDKGKPIYTREYYFKNKDGKNIVIQDHSAGHNFGSTGDQRSHFNVRPAENTRTGKVPGTQAHYKFNK